MSEDHATSSVRSPESPETRDEQPETKNQRPETRDQEPTQTSPNVPSADEEQEGYEMSRNVPPIDEDPKDHEMSRNVTHIDEDPKDHEMSRNVTLSARKERAIRAMIEGANITRAARHAGVARETVSRWLNHDRDFQVELWFRQSEIWGELRGRVAKLAHKAVDKLEDALAREHVLELSAARAILDLTPLRRGEMPPPPALLEALRATAGEEPSEPDE